MPALCLGEAIVDLVCERPVEDLAQADAFRPHFGGAVANVAVTAAALGADIWLAGGAGDDPWGRWLRARLAAAGVGLEHFELIVGADTPIAFVTTRPDGEPQFRIYGDGIAATLRAVAGRLPDAVAASDALFLSSNTLAGEPERQLTLAAREQALELGRPVVFDPNLRLHRWPSVRDAVAEANRCVPGALLVRANRTEAELLTGEPDPERAANALLAAGARVAAVTLGAGGALLRGEARGDAPGRPARVVSAVGAGDTFTGVLLAHLALAGYQPAAAAAALPQAVEESARATERWGAVD
ncbi:MAG: carbohydrate kinase family protein [Solirubrobacteraceae bacterium]